MVSDDEVCILAKNLKGAVWFLRTSQNRVVVRCFFRGFVAHDYCLPPRKKVVVPVVGDRAA